MAAAPPPSDPFAANVRLHALMKAAVTDCVQRKLILALGSQSPLVALTTATPVVSKFFSQLRIQGRSYRVLWLQFTFHVKRIVRERRRLAALLQEWARRRRLELSELVERWAALEEEARRELSFVEYVLLFVSPTEKQRVAAMFRMHCCHQWIRELRTASTKRKRDLAAFYQRTLSSRIVSPSCYQITKVLLLSGVRKHVHFRFHLVNIQTLVAVAARMQYAEAKGCSKESSMADVSVADTMALWVHFRVQSDSGVSVDVLNENPTLSKWSTSPLFPEAQARLAALEARKRRRTTMFEGGIVLTFGGRLLRGRSQRNGGDVRSGGTALVLNREQHPAEVAVEHGCATDARGLDFSVAVTSPTDAASHDDSEDESSSDGQEEDEPLPPVPPLVTHAGPAKRLSVGGKSTCNPIVAVKAKRVARQARNFPKVHQMQPNFERPHCLIGDWWINDAEWQGCITCQSCVVPDEAQKAHDRKLRQQSSRDGIKKRAAWQSHLHFIETRLFKVTDGVGTAESRCPKHRALRLPHPPPPQVFCEATQGNEEATEGSGEAKPTEEAAHCTQQQNDSVVDATPRVAPAPPYETTQRDWSTTIGIEPAVILRRAEAHSAAHSVFFGSHSNPFPRLVRCATAALADTEYAEHPSAQPNSSALPKAIASTRLRSVLQHRV